MRIPIHKEGWKIIFQTVLLLFIVNFLFYILNINPAIAYSFSIISILLIIFVLRFFRRPWRKIPDDPDILYAPADGKIVTIEEVFENEYFKTNKLQVSIFMSVWNVHINWIPVNSIVKYFRYHPGKYLVARHPKSSELNERTSIVLSTDKGTDILLRQIAGYVARRVICYAREGKEFQVGNELGFIRFGSRVDIFLPPGTPLLIKPGDKVKGLISQLAMLKNV